LSAETIPLTSLAVARIRERAAFHQFAEALNEGGRSARGESIDEGDGPCVGCPWQERCAQGLACVAFELFTQSVVPIRWRSAPRQPKAEIYRRLFAAHGTR
jgi:hypothetical protein